MALNDDIYRDKLRRRALLTMYERTLQRELDAVLVRHGINLSSIVEDSVRLTASMQLRINTEIRQTYRRIYEMAETELQRLYKSQVGFETSMINSSLRNIYVAKQTARNVRIRDLILRDNKNLAEHFASISTAERRIMTQTIRNGLADSLSNRQIASNIRQRLLLPRTQVNTLARTAITDISTAAADEVYQNNIDVIDGYQYVATLDGRTSIICARLDGKVFSVDKGGPRPPQHFNCRSTTIPVFKSAGSLMNVDNTRIKKRRIENLTERRRASINGQVPARLTYEEWLRTQPNEVKLQLLGNQQRVRIFNQGELRLTQFSNAEGRLTSLERLDELS